jgi:flagellar motor switch protein FliM
MAEDVLSQAELEMLLSALESGEEPAANRAVPRPQPSGGTSQGAPQKPREKIIAYDFKRPQPVAMEQIRALRTLHDQFAGNFAAALSALLRNSVLVKLTALDQLTYGEFVSGLENPTCFNLLRLAPPECNLFLDISPSILYPIIDRLLGGGRDPSPIARRPLTEIELRLVARVTTLVLQELRGAWHNGPPVELSVQRVECNPHAVQGVPPAEAVVVISFELSIHESRGIMKLCIPRNSLERITSKLSGEPSAATGRRQATGETIQHMAGNLQHARVELVARLAETKITSADLFNLHIGDIITTEKDVHSPIAVCLEGITKFRAHPGAFQGHKAIRIEEAVNPPAGQATRP